ncbi:MAG: tRNA epoxyqueuosine(34) reductase QueG [Deltaproteobacteria bacterium]|nr:tRNA epoxyqueuosine(34) reductase QueG [Deltaproteobacteria bacterium]
MKKDFLRRIEELANREGFVFLGCSPITSVSSDVFDRFTYWLNEGFGGSMAYLSKVKQDLREIIDWAVSVFVFAWLYPRYESQSRYGFGRIASYALWRDYHRVFKKRLLKLGKNLTDEFPGLRFKCITDAFPILEKALALQVDSEKLFMGKNTLLIHKNFGSFFLLGEIVTNMKVTQVNSFRYDNNKLGCGNCVKCVTECPTNALNGCFIDARKCISYLTIEYKGPFNLEQMRNVGDWLFGCDICQQVCPFNHKIKGKNFCSFLQTDLRVTPSFSLIEVLSLNEEKFKSLFMGTPVLRAGLEGFQRNAIAVCFNQGFQEALPMIRNLTKSDSDTVNQTASLALSKWKVRSVPTKLVVIN